MLATRTEGEPYQTAASALSVCLRDGRKLGFAEYGDRQGEPAFYFHGWPSSRLEAAAADDLARQFGVRLIAIDRPGIGLSDPKPSRKLIDWPEDVTELAAALDVAKFSVIGNSGGAPYAITCGAKLPKSVKQIVILCGLGPLEVTDCRRKMVFTTRLALRIAGLAPKLAAFLTGLALRKTTAGHQAALFPESMIGQLPECDRRTLRQPQWRELLTRAIREAFRQGARGAAVDGCLFAQPWWSSLPELKVPVRVWHGEQDTIVPVENGRFYAQHLSQCEATFYPDEGHFSLPFNRMREIFEAARKD